MLFLAFDTEKKVRGNRYYYFDTPMGQDIDKKLWSATRIGGKVFIFCLTTDVLCYSNPKGLVHLMFRGLRVGWPIMSTVWVWTILANYATVYRQKDDWRNWAFGNAAVASIWGVWSRSAFNGWITGLGLFLTTCFYKKSWDMGAPGFVIKDEDLHRPMVHDCWVKKKDMTLMRHRPGDYTTEY